MIGVSPNKTIPGTAPTTIINGHTDFNHPSPTYATPTIKRWTGDIRVPYSETYTFRLTSDDGSRLYIDNVLITNNWSDHGVITVDGTISLTANQSYDIRIEWYNSVSTGGHVISMSSPSIPMAIIPDAFLRPI